MKTLYTFIIEKLIINSKTVVDNWVLIDAPVFSNYDSSDNKKFRDIFNDRIFDIYSYDNITSIKMQVVMVKTSELETIKEIYKYRNLPKAYELPDKLSIKASKSQINKFIKDHKEDWNYKELKRYE